MEGGVAQLEWSKEIIDRKLPISPYKYPSEAGLHAATRDYSEGLHGFLDDSLPDQWGNLLMRRRLAKQGIDIRTLSVLDRLALVGREGRGALAFEPAPDMPSDVETLDLDALAKSATALLAGEEADLADTLFKLGAGSGGARPKIHVGFDGNGRISAGEGKIAPGHEAWMVKFKASQDYDDIGPIEEAYASMAEAAGLALSAHRLIEAREGPGYFATRRFDRLEGGKRLHMVSLAGAIESRAEIPSEYDTFLRATLFITRRKDDVVAAFQRMLFNILAHNRDDHTKQHAYLMDPLGGWSLAPAYDLTYAAGPGGQHYLAVEGEGDKPTRALVEKLGARHGIDAQAVKTVIERVREALADWPKFASAVGVTSSSKRIVTAAHEKVWAQFE